MISTPKEIEEPLEANLKQKEQLHEYELQNEKSRKKIIYLNAQQEEARKLNGRLTNQLNERESLCEGLPVEVVSLIQDLERSKKQVSQHQKIEESGKVFDEMIAKKISPLIKASLGSKEDPSCKMVKDEGSTIQVREVGGSNENKGK